MKNLVLETYSGNTDSKDHQLYSNTKMVISAASDAVKCRMFPSTFTGTAMAWFTTLPRGSFMNFRDFSSKFLVQFLASKIRLVTIDDLYNVRQSEGETLKQRRAKAEKDGSQKDISPVNRQGREKGESSKRRDNKPKSSDKFVKEQLYPKKESFERRRPWSQADYCRREGSGKSLSMHLTELLREVKATHVVVESERDVNPPRVAVDKTKWCEYHRSTGHDTRDCFTLKNEIERLIRAGRSQLNDRGDRWQGDRQQGNHYKGNRQQDDHRRDDLRQTPAVDKKETLATRKKGAEETFNKDLEPSVETINTIAGGFGRGGDTPAARCRHVRAVSSVQEFSTPFGFQHPDIVISSADFEGIKTHKDDLVVVMVRINSFNVRRVLLDQGSSADIIYDDAFDQLGLTYKHLMPYSGTLVGFSGEQVWVRGYLDLDTIFGVDENAKLMHVRYLVLQVVASYNVIIGQNTLNRLCAVISTAHLAVKYPLIYGKIGKIAVDQRRARECYNNCLSLCGKKGANDGHICHEIEILEGDQSQQGEQDRSQSGARRRGRWTGERFGGPGSNRNQERPDDRTGRDGQFTDICAEERWANVIADLEMYKFSRGVMAIQPRLTISQERRMEKLVEDNFDLFNWS
ncbi:uncharacterized protein LOC130736852 [Lotus japonicus]|uniref:uncharacterized protein LOC130736852 n=1 Tax=Lotus japonicus TaxID=34305 RepID=UPI0025861FDE|nr:uncharacterized protein LOC130736852 [Lotus japonicus]